MTTGCPAWVYIPAAMGFREADKQNVFIFD